MAKRDAASFILMNDMFTNESTRELDAIAKALGERRLKDADALCQRMLSREPTNARAIHFAGMIAHAKGDQAGAEALIKRSIALEGDVPHFYNNYGAVLLRSGRHLEAVNAFQRATDLDPLSFDAAMNLARTFLTLGRVTEAEGTARRALALQPGAASARVLLAVSLDKQFRNEEALATYRQALEMKPEREWQLLSSMAILMERLGRIDEAVELHRRAAEGKPVLAWLWSNYLYSLRYSLEEESPERVFQEHESWAKRQAEPLYTSFPCPTNDRNPDRKLRIGYISADFSGHSASTCMEPLLHAHDRTSWEVWGYSDVSRADAVTARCKAATDHWREIRGLSDAEVAKLIRNDRIDVLIDHTGHMGNNRLMVFARRAAPVQVAFPGYPGTTGLKVIDAFITDIHQDPPSAEEYYTEPLVRCSGSPRCYRAPVDAPNPGPVPLDRRGHITFGVVQRPAKLTVRMFPLWAEILDAVPTAHLCLLMGKQRPDEIEAWLTPLLKHHEIDPGRVHVIPRQRRGKYFQVLRDIDIILDTNPYNGCATTLDSLWMGVPVVTRAGRTYVSRVGASILSHVGLPDLIAQTSADYVRIATGLAGDQSRLRDLRATLRARMATSAVVDAPRVALELEAICRELWRAWCARQQ